MLGISTKNEFKVGHINEGYHLNPHIDEYNSDNELVEVLAGIIENLIVKSKHSFVFKNKLKDLIRHISSNINDVEDWKLLGEFVQVTKIEDPEQRKTQLIAFLKKAKALEKE